MAEKILNTRVQLRYDSYNNWTSTSLGTDKGANFILKAGEIGICYLPSGTNENQVSGSQPPQILFKVGDGTSKFSALPWASAKAADVYEWAKQASLPVTKEGTGNVVSGIAWDEATKGIKFTTASVATSEGLEQLTNRVKTIEDTYATDNDLSGAVEAINGAIATAKSEAIADAKTETEKQVKALADGAVKANADAIAGIKNGEELNSFQAVENGFLVIEEALGEFDDLKTGTKSLVSAINDVYDKAEATDAKVTTLIGSDANKSVRTIANEELAAQLIGENAKESLDTLAEIAAWIQSHPDDASAMNQAITALQNQLKGISAGEGTVKKYVDDAIAALKIGDYAKAADLTTLANRVTALETAKNGYGDIVTHNVSEFATSAQGQKADSAVQAVEFAGTTLTKSGTTASISQANARTALGLKSAAYTESSAYATSAQGTKADSALQSVETGTGLKVSTKVDNKQTIEFDEAVVFVFNCGSSTTVI